MTPIITWIIQNVDKMISIKHMIGHYSDNWFCLRCNNIFLSEAKTKQKQNKKQTNKQTKQNKTKNKIKNH